MALGDGDADGEVSASGVEGDDTAGEGAGVSGLQPATSRTAARPAAVAASVVRDMRMLSVDSDNGQNDRGSAAIAS